jgi:hypothetical protein
MPTAGRRKRQSGICAQKRCATEGNSAGSERAVDHGPADHSANRICDIESRYVGSGGELRRDFSVFMTRICIGGTLAEDATPKMKAAARNGHLNGAMSPTTIRDATIAAGHRMS